MSGASRLKRKQCWQWLFQAEAASGRIGSGYEDIPIFLGGGDVMERLPSGSMSGVARILSCADYAALLKTLCLAPAGQNRPHVPIDEISPNADVHKYPWCFAPVTLFVTPGNLGFAS